MIILTCDGYEYEFPPWVSTTVMHRNHKIEIFRYVYLTWNIETSTNIVPVLGAIQADLTYRVYNISRSNWMFKHPWDSWNRMQFYSTSSKPTCDKPKAEGRRPENASEASSMDPKCIILGVNSSRRARSVFIPKCLHLNWVKRQE